MFEYGDRVVFKGNPERVFSVDGVYRLKDDGPVFVDALDEEDHLLTGLPENLLERAPKEPVQGQVWRVPQGDRFFVTYASPETVHFAAVGLGGVVKVTPEEFRSMGAGLELESLWSS